MRSSRSIYPMFMGFIAMALLLGPPMAQAGNDLDELLSNAVYVREYKNHLFPVPPEKFAFLVENLVGILAVLSQPEIRQAHPQIENLRIASISGPPSDFMLKAFGQTARVTMQRPQPNQVVYLANVEINKLQLNVSGQALVSITILPGQPGGQDMRANLLVAFRPSSALVATAIKPVLDQFKAELDRAGDRALSLADGFLQIYSAELDQVLSRSGLLSKTAMLIEQNKRLRQQASGAPVTSQVGDSPLLFYLIAVLVCLVIGLALGFLAAETTRSTRDQRLARFLARSMREQRAREQELAALAGQSPGSDDLASAIQEQKELGRELRQRTETALEKLREES